jgi:hypothetical protein
MVDLPEPALYILIASLILSGVPRFGRSVLSFLRDLDDYRRGRGQ